MTSSTATRRCGFSLLGLIAIACHAGSCGGGGDSGCASGSGSTADESESADSTTGGTVGPASGLLACPAGEQCTLVLVAEAFDDRVEVYAARGPGPVYRGAIDFDLKPNPMGDNENEFLDEPFGMTVTEQGLAVLLGHYPMRNSGSLVLVPHDLMAMQDDGATLASSTFFAGGTFSAGVVDIALDEEEPIFVRAHPSGRLLVGVFANNLFDDESLWTNPGKLLVIDPVSGEVGKRTLDMVGEGACSGAWAVVSLDAQMNSIVLGCDGDDGAVLLDVSGVGEGTVAEAAAAIDGCVADVPFPNRRVRYAAPDGGGGFLLVDSTPNYDMNGGRLWHFDSECVGDSKPLDQKYWEVREVVHLPNDAGPRWLMPIGRGEQARGVHVIGDQGDGPVVCKELTELEASWADGPDGAAIHPFALALTHAADGLAIGAGPVDPVKDMAGYGRVLWLDLDTSVDPCVASPIQNIIDLTASAPAVSPDDPATWRRGPNQVFVQQYG